MIKSLYMQPEKKLKILYVITKGVWGGAQKYVYSLATKIPKDHFDIKVVCGEGGILKEKLEKAGINVVEINNLKRDVSFFSEFKNFYTLYKIIKIENPDIIHLNSAKASGLGAFTGRILGVNKIVFTAHGWTFNEDRNIFSKSIIWLLSWMTVTLSHKTIVIATREMHQALSMPFVSREKIKLIRNGIEKIDFLERDLAKKELLPELYQNLENNTLWIGTISELTKNKGLEYTITALSKIEKPFVFIIIGEGEERKNLEKIISNHRLEEKVFLIGFKDLASRNLKAFDIFTLTSIKEGLPYSILEAGLTSLPVVSSKVGGIPDIIDNDKNGLLIEAGNISEIKNALETLIEDRTKRIEFGIKLKEKVEKEFAIEQMTEKTLKLYVD